MSFLTGQQSTDVTLKDSRRLLPIARVAVAHNRQGLLQIITRLTSAKEQSGRQWSSTGKTRAARQEDEAGGQAVPGRRDGKEDGQMLSDVVLLEHVADVAQLVSNQFTFLKLATALSQECSSLDRTACLCDTFSTIF